jgi:hypothetical protein
MSKRRPTASEPHKCSAASETVQGRTQWDAMTEATRHGKWNATRLALLIFVRYAPRSAAGAVLVDAALRLVELLARNH